MGPNGRKGVPAAAGSTSRRDFIKQVGIGSAILVGTMVTGVVAIGRPKPPRSIHRCPDPAPRVREVVHPDGGPGTTSPHANATYIGRWAELTEPCSCHCAIPSGSRVRLQFTGTSLALNLWVPPRSRPSGYPADTEISWSIDGGAFVRTTIWDGMALASGLTDSTHTCDLYLAGNSTADKRWTNHFGLAIKSFTVDEGRTTSPWPTGNKLKMLTIGDSMGEGVYAYDDLSDPMCTEGRKNFGNLLGEMIGADNHCFSFGGASTTNTHEFSGLPGMSQAIPYAMGGSPPIVADDPEYDIVIIEVVANDAELDSSTFRTNYAALIDWVRVGSPHATIFCMRPFKEWANARITDVLDVASRKGCVYVDTSPWLLAMTHARHLTAEDHGRVAAYLRPTVQKHAIG